MEIRVVCYAGYRGEETPRQLILGNRTIGVAAVQDRWLAPDHRYFKLLGDDGGLYLVRHDPALELLQLVFFRAAAAPSPDPSVMPSCLPASA